MNLIWKIYYIGTQIKYITVEDFDLPYIVVTESQALEFVSGGKKAYEYMIMNNELIIKPKIRDKYMMIPVFSSNTTNCFKTLKLDPSWLADSSIDQTSRYELQWRN